MPTPQLSPDPDDTATLVRQLELTVTRKISGLLHGDYQGLLPGAGSELGDTRPYEAGDDVRRIDWSATARSGNVQLRTTIEDRELTVHLVVDASGSMDFGTVNTSKRYLAAAAAAVFGFLAARGANRVGGGVLAEQWRWLAPRAGRDNVRSLVHTALETPTGTRTGTTTGTPIGLGDAFDQLLSSVRRRSLLVVISDFTDPSAWSGPFTALAALHEVIAVEIVDPRELNLTDIGVIAFQDAESGRQRWVDTTDPVLRQRFTERRAEQRNDLAELFRTNSVAHLELFTGGAVGDDDAWITQVIDWLHLRRRTVALTGRRR
jgi:uncharacterized protein (DUF58 family)